MPQDQAQAKQDVDEAIIILHRLDVLLSDKIGVSGITFDVLGMLKTQLDKIRHNLD